MEISKVNLGKGFIDIYDFGEIKLHCRKSIFRPPKWRNNT